MKRTLWLLATGSALAVGTLSAAPLSLDELRAQRKALAFRERRVLANNDGCDALYFPRDAELTPAAFLDRRTTAMAGTQVGCISYCTISSGFSFFTHDTKVGTVLTRQGYDYGMQPKYRNIAQELIEQGADCLSLVVDYAHRHDMEAFWAMRMNDTHDVAHQPGKPFLLFPPLKEQHPEWLVGDPVKRTSHGRWSSVNYAIPEIRELAFRYIEEVCTNYDVDGIELDYFRHFCYFPSTANGGRASDGERALMTALMERVRAMTEEVGAKRGRPILLTIRVSDDMTFNHDMGLDVETWMAKGLVDIAVGSGYFRFHRWQPFVELAHKHGVAAYAGFSESRIRGETRFKRNSVPGYRARATNAWFAGVDGIYVFNQFNPKWGMWSEMGATETLAGKEKLYFVNSRLDRPDRFLKGSDSLRTLPTLCPDQGIPLKAGETQAVEIMVAEDVATARANGLSPTVTACVEVPGLDDPSRLTLSVNGQAAAAPTVAKTWLDFPVDPTALKRGLNRIEFQLANTPADQNPGWPVRYDGTALPAPPWHSDYPRKSVVVELQDGGLLVADRGTNSGDYRYFRHAWGKEPDGKAVFEADVKVVSGVSSVIFGDGATGDRLRLYPDHVNLHHSSQNRVDMDTTDRFHSYRLEVEGKDIVLFIDGEKRLEAKGAYGQGRVYRNEIAFGAASSGELGEAIWKSLRARGGTSASCNDFAIRIQYPEPAN
jgi:hypothetical protein